MKKLMLGDEAVARGAFEAGAKVVSSYPGTPSTEITEFAAMYKEINCEWATNEKVAAEVAFGAAMAGARSMTCMKHVGVNVAADPLFTAAYTGVGGGLVVACADDPAMHSSQNEQDSRYYARAAHIPMLEPADSQECKDFTALAFSLSEQYDTPVFVRLTTRIAHARSAVELGQRTGVEVKPYKRDFMKYVMMPGMARKRHVVVEQRMKAMAEDANTLSVNRVEMGETSLGIITSGACYTYVKEALPNASVLKLGLVHPLPQKLITEFAQKVDRLVVIEELEPVIEQQVAALGIAVEGKNRQPREADIWTGRRSGARRHVAGPAAGFVPRLSPPRRFLRHEKAEAERDGGYRLLYHGRLAAAEYAGCLPVHGRQHRHGLRRGKGPGKGFFPQNRGGAGRQHLHSQRHHRAH